MSPPPLPLGRLLRSARGAGSPASLSVPGPGPEGSKHGGHAPSPAFASSSPDPAVAGLFSRNQGQRMGREDGGRGERVPRPQAPRPQDSGWGRRPAGSRGRPFPSLLPSFLSPPPWLALRSASRCPPHIVRSLWLLSPLPLAGPSAWVFPHFFFFL